jgi:hypothetical protein
VVLCRLVTHPDCLTNCARCDHSQRDPGQLYPPMPASMEARMGIDTPGVFRHLPERIRVRLRPAKVHRDVWEAAMSTALERRSAVAADAVGASRSWRFSPVMSA